MLSTPRSSNSDVVAWYSGADASAAEIAANAYKDAVRYFETELSRDDKNQIAWIRTHASMGDVLDVVQQAQTQYSQRSEKNARARKWLSSFASAVFYYGGVLDSLAQADPLHAGLAWGAMKFVLMGVLSRDRMVGDLCKALTKIAEVLPRMQLDGMLYNTPRMADAIAKLYARILLFLQDAVIWCQDGAFRRTVHSLVRPLLFQDAVAEINEYTKSIDDLASAASRAEIRGLSVANTSLQQQLQHLSQALHQSELANTRQLNSMRSHVQGKLDDMSTQTDQVLKQILQIATNNYTLSHSIKLDTTNIQGELFSRHRERILKLLTPEVDPEHVLHVCSALSRRNQALLPGRDIDLISKQVRAWASTPRSCMLVLRNLPRAEPRSKSIALQIVQFLKSATSIPVFWHLSCPTKTRSRQDMCVVVATLVYQALRHNASVLAKGLQQSDIDAFGEVTDLPTWTGLAKRVFAQIKGFFLVVEMDDLYRSFAYDSGRIQAVHDVLADIYGAVNDSGSALKLLVVTRGDVQRLSGRNGTGDAPVLVHVDGAMPVATRLKARPALRLITTKQKAISHATESRPGELQKRLDRHGQ